MYIQLSDEYARKTAAKRWRTYLKEDGKKRGRSNKNQNIIVTILWLVKLMAKILEKIRIKKKRIVEKILVD
jgi:hypothetical protein